MYILCTMTTPKAPRAQSSACSRAVFWLLALSWQASHVDEQHSWCNSTATTNDSILWYSFLLNLMLFIFYTNVMCLFLETSNSLHFIQINVMFILINLKTFTLYSHAMISKALHTKYSRYIAKYSRYMQSTQGTWINKYDK